VLHDSQAVSLLLGRLGIVHGGGVEGGARNPGLTGCAGVSDNNGFLVVLELPLEASPDTASTPPAVRNAPDLPSSFSFSSWLTVCAS
jgi:hypothetical protein